MFRNARSEDIDGLHQLLVAEAAQARFDPRLTEEPFRSGLRSNLNSIRKKGRRRDEDLQAQLLVWDQDGEVASCAPQAQVACEMFLRRGFLPLDTTDLGARVLKMPKLGSTLATQDAGSQILEPFREVTVR